MNKIIRYWNENRRKIILIIIGLTSLILLIQSLNYFARMQRREGTNQNIIKEDTSQLPTQSIITGENIDKETTEGNVRLVEQFIEFCNEGNTKEAYNMLTKECKETLFTTEEEFTNNYYNLIFTERKLYGINNFRNSSNYYTYEVKFYQDALSTGKMQESNVYQDYITIDKKQNKISINSLIQINEINKTIEKKGIQMTVVKKEVYKEYEKYEIIVKNNNKKTVLLDSKESSKNIFAIGDDNASYPALINEISDNLLEIKEGSTREYKLKISKIYNPSVTIDSLYFQDIVLDGDAYKNQEEVERLKLTIDL